jgi:hypothetical protein
VIGVGTFVRWFYFYRESKELRKKPACATLSTKKILVDATRTELEPSG